MIAEANNLPDDDVRAGSKLIIPIAPGKAGDTVAYSKKATRYKVRKGDTVGSIADDFEVPVDKVAQMEPPARQHRGRRTHPGHL